MATTMEVAEDGKKRQVEDCTEEKNDNSISDDEKRKLLNKIRSRVASAPIKEEFIDFKRFNQIYGGTKTSQEPLQKKQKKTGQNKSRPRPKKPLLNERLCLNMAKTNSCIYGENCKFNHDIAGIMSKKQPDIGPKCYNFDTFGHCQFGLMCRYGNSHIGDDFKNVTDEARRIDLNTLTSNHLVMELKRKLRKRRVKYPKSDEFLKTLPRNGKGKNKAMRDVSSSLPQGAKNGDCKKANPVSAEVISIEVDTNKSAQDLKCLSTSVDEKSDVKEVLCEISTVHECTGPSASNGSSSEKVEVKSAPTQELQNAVDISDTKTKTEMSQKDGCMNVKSDGISGGDTVPTLREKKPLDVQGKLMLAPLTTVGNLPFRRICKRFGADITCGEMAMCTNLLMGQACEWALLRRHHTEDMFGVQLCGAFPDTMTKCAELLTSELELDFIDVNVGCPIDLVYHKGAGAGLMNRMPKFEQIVRGMSSVMDIPLTVKLRMGVIENKNIAHTFIPRIYDWGASLVTVHGRSREARYTKSADWDYLRSCAQVAAPHPFVGNGDILSFEDANEHFNNSGSAGLMIARGALIKPWIFTEIKEQRHWDISSNERLDILRDFTNFGLEHWGSDSQGVENTRKFILEWLSFLHRYIPVGLMERLPVKINERPPFYFGRNDLETMMASANCNDWIKISEMLLGPVPDDFSFLPKHKANSYK